MPGTKSYIADVWSETRRITATWLPWTAPGRRPVGPAGVARLGHRSYVGGKWEAIGRLQYEFLVSQGLLPHHVLLDIACGSLRGGVHFIPFLDVGHYLGIDKEEALIAAGVAHELGSELIALKRPQFVVSPAFEFERFPLRPDFAWAHSLFTHLPQPLIHACLEKLRQAAHRETRCYATFFECGKPRVNPAAAHDHKAFLFTRSELEQFGAAAGWRMKYVGDWNHPRGQKMVLFYEPVEGCSLNP